MATYAKGLVCVDDGVKAQIRARLNAGETTTAICEALGITGVAVREEMEILKASGHPRFAGQVIPDRKMFGRIGSKPFYSPAGA